MRAKTLGERHPYTLMCINNLALALHHAASIAEAAERHVEAAEKLPPREEAVQLLTELVEVRRQVLQPDHADSLALGFLMAK